MSTTSADRSVLSAGAPDRGPLAGTARGPAGGRARVHRDLAGVPHRAGRRPDHPALQRGRSGPRGSSIIAAFCAIYVILVPSWPSSPRYAHAGLAVLAALAAARLHPVRRHGRGQPVDLRVVRRRAAGRQPPLGGAGGRWRSAPATWSSATPATSHMTDFLSNLLPVMFLGLAMIGLRRQMQLTQRAAPGARGGGAAGGERGAAAAGPRHARPDRPVAVDDHAQVRARRPAAVAAAGQAPSGTGSRDEIEQVAAVSRQTLHDIREAISGYRRPTLAVEIDHRPRGPGERGHRRRTTTRSSRWRPARSTRTRRRRWPGACARRSPT